MVDDDMMDAALSRAAQTIDRDAEQAHHDVVATWTAIKADLRRAGPFAKMILSFREGAIEALSELIVMKTDDPRVQARQAEIRRFITTIEVVHAYRDTAAAYDANAEATTDLSEEDREFIVNLEEPPDVS